MRTLNSKVLLQRVAWLGVLCCCAIVAAFPAPQGSAGGRASSERASNERSSDERSSNEQGAVTAQIEITGQKLDKAAVADASNVVVWLTPLDASAGLASARVAGTAPRLVQRDKTFEPHLLVVVAGTTVEFPNEDPFLHNVFSLFDGKRFDLGFYEAGSTRSVRFDRVGISFLFCNIHPEMSAVVVAVPTRSYGISDRAGRVTIANVADGNYRMEVWAERSLPADLKNLTRTVNITASGRALPAIQIIENPSFTTNHKNKFGQDYVPPAGSSY